MRVSTFEGLGPASLVPQRGAAQLAELGLSADEGFVLSRVDGRTSLADIMQLVPFDAATTTAILQRLWKSRAIDLPGQKRPEARPEPPPPTPTPSKDPPARAAKPATAPTVGSAANQEANVKATAKAKAANAGPKVDGLDLSVEQAARIDEYHKSLDKRDAFQLLGVERDASQRDIKRAYFRLSKEFHPDRFYGRELGSYRPHLTAIFQAINAAFELLTDDTRRAAYIESLPAPK